MARDGVGGVVSERVVVVVVVVGVAAVGGDDDVGVVTVDVEGDGWVG